MEPRYVFNLNPHRFKTLTHCPSCNTQLEIRKLPFLIKIEPDVTTVFSMESQYCPVCDWLILSQHKLEGLLAAFCMQYKLQAIIGNDYAVLGTVDEPAWQKGMTEGLDFEGLLPHTHPFKEIRSLSGLSKKLPRKGLNLGSSSGSEPAKPPKSKRLSRRQRKKSKGK